MLGFDGIFERDNLRFVTQVILFFRRLQIHVFKLMLDEDPVENLGLLKHFGALQIDLFFRCARFFDLCQPVVYLLLHLDLFLQDLNGLLLRDLIDLLELKTNVLVVQFELGDRLRVSKDSLHGDLEALLVEANVLSSDLGDGNHDDVVLS